jgi:hypothetical protein
MAAITAGLSDAQVDALSTLATGIIDGMKQVAPLANVIESQLFRLTAGTALAGTIAEP